MKIFFESDRECTVDGVGLLPPGQPVEVDPSLFVQYHGISPTEAKLPDWLKVYADKSTEGEEV